MIPLLSLLAVGVSEAAARTDAEPEPTAGEPKRAVRMHEVYVAPGLQAHQSPRQIGGGLGTQLGYRWRRDALTLGGAVSVGRLQVSGVFVELEVGADLFPRATRYHPWVGAEVTTLFGAYRRQTADRPDPARMPAVAVRAALRLLAFHWERTTWSFAEISLGTPLEGLGSGVSVGVTPVALGVPF